MKKIGVCMLALVIGLATVAVAGMEEKAADAPAWFDMQNCEFCKHLVTDEKLLENMTWEHHDISNGVLSITTVAPEFKESYKKAQAGMMAVAQSMESGEKTMADIKMCGHCQQYGMLMFGGAKFDYVQGKGADVVVITSADPEMVKKIKAFGERNRVEHAKWETMETPK